MPKRSINWKNRSINRKPLGFLPPPPHFKFWIYTKIQPVFGSISISESGGRDQGFKKRYGAQNRSPPVSQKIVKIGKPGQKSVQIRISNFGGKFGRPVNIFGKSVEIFDKLNETHRLLKNRTKSPATSVTMRGIARASRRPRRTIGAARVEASRAAAPYQPRPQQLRPSHVGLQSRRSVQLA
jgi:hypothetical protein